MAAAKASGKLPRHKLIEYTTVVFKDGRLRFLNLTGKAVSISANGLCILTRYPLKAGHVIEFRKKVLQCSHGVVTWIRRTGGLYLAGADFLRKGSDKKP